MAEAGLSKGARARRSILDAAYNLFIRQGYAATSMRQIADGAGMVPGSLYNHFSSKEEIFRAILMEQHPFASILPILGRVKGTSVEEFCRNAAHTLVEELGHHPDFLNLMLTEIVEFRGEHIPMIFEKFMPQLMPLVGRFQSLQGELRDMPPLVLVRAFLGMFFAYYITGILMQRVPPGQQENALDHFVDLFLYGALVKESA